MDYYFSKKNWKQPVHWQRCPGFLIYQPVNDQCSPLYRKQLIDLNLKPIGLISIWRGTWVVNGLTSQRKLFSTGMEIIIDRVTVHLKSMLLLHSQNMKNSCKIAHWEIARCFRLVNFLIHVYLRSACLFSLPLNQGKSRWLEVHLFYKQSKI